MSDCDLFPQLPPPLPGLGFAFQGNSCSWGFVRARRAQQQACQRLAEPARCCCLRVWATVMGGVGSSRVLSPSAWGESGLGIPTACAGSSSWPLLGRAAMQGSSVSPSLLKWQLHLAETGGV